MSLEQALQNQIKSDSIVMADQLLKAYADFPFTVDVVRDMLATAFLSGNAYCSSILSTSVGDAARAITNIKVDNLISPKQ